MDNMRFPRESPDSEGISKTPWSFTLQVQQNMVTANQEYPESPNILLCPLPFHAVGTSRKEVETYESLVCH